MPYIPSYTMFNNKTQAQTTIVLLYKCLWLHQKTLLGDFFTIIIILARNLELQFKILDALV